MMHCTTRRHGDAGLRLKTRVVKHLRMAESACGRGRAYQPIVKVTSVGALVCSEGLKSPTSSYEKP